MSWLRRALGGALAGAILVLLLHPVVRPLMLHGSTRFGPARMEDFSEDLRARKLLPVPKDGPDFAMWMEAGASQVVNRTPTSAEDNLLLAEFAFSAEESEPQNAYWPQMTAVFQTSLGNNEEASAAWQRASRKHEWNDYSSVRAEDQVRSLQQQSGEKLSWHLAAAWAAQRSWSLPALEILAYQLRRTDSRATELNAFNVIQHVPEGKRRSMLRLALLGGSEAQALAAQESDEMPPIYASFASILAASTPGACLVAAIIGGLVWLLGRLIEKAPWMRVAFSQPYSAPIGTLLGLLVYLVVRQPLAAFAVALSFSTYTIAHPWKQNEDGPRPKVGGLVAAARAAGVAGGIALILLIMGLSESAQTVLVLRPDAALAPIGSPVLLAMALFTFAICLSAAPAWAHFRRVPSWLAGGLALRQYGLALALFGLVGAIVSAPIALGLDRAAAQALEPQLFVRSN